MHFIASSIIIIIMINTSFRFNGNDMQFSLYHNTHTQAAIQVIDAHSQQAIKYLWDRLLQIQFYQQMRVNNQRNI